MNRALGAFIILLIIAVSVVACGKKGPPKSPNQNSQYPQQYPTQK